MANATYLWRLLTGVSHPHLCQKGQELPGSSNIPLLPQGHSSVMEHLAKNRTPATGPPHKPRHWDKKRNLNSSGLGGRGNAEYWGLSGWGNLQGASEETEMSTSTHTDAQSPRTCKSHREKTLPSLPAPPKPRVLLSFPFPGKKAGLGEGRGLSQRLPGPTKAEPALQPVGGAGRGQAGWKRLKSTSWVVSQDRNKTREGRTAQQHRHGCLR